MGNYQSAHLQCWIEQHVELKLGQKTLGGTVLLDVHNVDAFHQSFDGITIIAIAGIENPTGGHNNDNIIVIPPTKEEATTATTKSSYSKKVIKVKSVIDLSNTKLCRGQHIFPFTITLPTYSRLENAESCHQRSMPKMTLPSPSKCGAAAISTTIWADWQQHHQHHQQQQQQQPVEEFESESTSSSSSSSSNCNATTCSSISSSSSDDCDMSISPCCTTKKVLEPILLKDDSNNSNNNIPEEPPRYTSSTTIPTPTVIYHVKASLKRKPTIPLSVDTDIKCHALLCSSVGHVTKKKEDLKNAY
jgi:hypothetical protein